MHSIGRFYDTYKKLISPILIFIRNLIIVFVAAIATLLYINKFGHCPWGSDTYGHLFKANVLYDSIKRGQPFLNYDFNWYNGIQPFRYWAPVPYYILALINLLTKNIFASYNAFIFIVFTVGGIGWLCWGYSLKRQNISLIIALLWFFVPNNLRVLFSEGNLPYVTVTTLLPFIFLFHYKVLSSTKVRYIFSLAATMALACLSHAMLAAMVGISLFIVSFFDAAIKKRYIGNYKAIVISFLGIMSASFWLYPALKGGIISIDKSAISNVMESLTYPFSISLNPFLRFTNIEIYYFGLAFAFISFFGFIMSTKNERAFFISSLIILAGTSKLLLPVLQKLPLNQLLWMSRFTSIAMAFSLIGILLWKSLRKSILTIFIFLIIADSSISFWCLCFNGQFPKDTTKTLESAAKTH